MLISPKKTDSTGLSSESLNNYSTKHPKRLGVKVMDKDTLSLSTNNNVPTSKINFVQSLVGKNTVSFLRNLSSSIFNPERTISKEEIPEIASKFSEELLLIDPEELTCGRIFQLVSKFLPDKQVKVYELNSSNNKDLENAYAYYKSSISGEKAFYINCDVNVTDEVIRAKLIKGITHEFTHALQDNIPDVKKDLNTIIIQRGMLKTFNNIFFTMEDTLYRYFNSVKHNTPKKEIDSPSSDELLKYFNNTRSQQDKDYQDILFPALSNRLCVDKQLASEFFIKELKDEAQAYKLADIAYKKVINKPDVYYNYDQFYVLFDDLANYLENKAGYKPIFPNNGKSKGNEIDNVVLDLELKFGQPTIIKNFDKLTTLKEKDVIKNGQLNIFDFCTEYNRDSLSKFYDEIINDSLKKYNLKPEKQIMEDIYKKITETSSKVKKHLYNLKASIGAEKEVLIADFIPLLYEDFTDHLSRQVKGLS